ncbi:hypothetical protein MA16_Dca006606 [Dendrobium catenatum]|uniref:Uncharacterized protein n=1 Tax=Dendrobium catenatum TaxID=906689 RepID=A0A2I0X5N4_9ASPA|nr:hypothetical protein MA16_Dca006606 [Dendrobium catenatum]
MYVVKFRRIYRQNNRLENDVLANIFCVGNASESASERFPVSYKRRKTFSDAHQTGVPKSDGNAPETKAFRLLRVTGEYGPPVIPCFPVVGIQGANIGGVEFGPFPFPWSLRYPLMVWLPWLLVPVPLLPFRFSPGVVSRELFLFPLLVLVPVPVLPFWLLSRGCFTRRWIQAVFSLNFEKNAGLARKSELEQGEERFDRINSLKDCTIDAEVDMSESIVKMFDPDPSLNEINIIKPGSYSFRIRGLAREYQHTCQSTGLMLWESALLLCNLISENPSIVAGKMVLELGSGSAGICSMISVQFAKFVVSTDGDSEALKLLQDNIASNLEQNLVQKMAIRKLLWGDKQDLDAIKELDCYKGGFEVIIGTDVSYSPEAISPLFFTAKELILKESNGGSKPALILCHIQRRVDEDSIVLVATELGFGLRDRWVHGMSLNDGVISSWFASGSSCWNDFQNTPLTILYFEL